MEDRYYPYVWFNIVLYSILPNTGKKMQLRLRCNILSSPTGNAGVNLIFLECIHLTYVGLLGLGL